MLGLLGVVCAVLGLLGLLHVVPMPLVVGILLLVGGIALAAYDRRDWIRRP